MRLIICNIVFKIIAMKYRFLMLSIGVLLFSCDKDETPDEPNSVNRDTELFGKWQAEYVVNHYDSNQTTTGYFEDKPCNELQDYEGASYIEFSESIVRDYSCTKTALLPEPTVSDIIYDLWETKGDSIFLGGTKRTGDYEIAHNYFINGDKLVTFTSGEDLGYKEFEVHYKKVN